MNEEKFPESVSIIMDGNRRWAKKHKLPIQMGHKEGAKTLEKIVKHAQEIGIKNLTVFAFSIENWQRSDEEVNDLMMLLRNYLENYTKKAQAENIKIKIFGDTSKFDFKLRKSIDNAIKTTQNNTGLSFNICLNYGGRDEIVNAAKKLAFKTQLGYMKSEDITEEDFEQCLYTAGLPDPDLMIRTSGEYRISGFLLWKIAYSEFVFLEKFWPDFSEKDLDECIEIYKTRNRRMGK